MMDNIPVLMVMLPFLAAPACYAIGRRKMALAWALACTLIALLTLCAGTLLLGGREIVYNSTWGLGLGIHLRADGFRALYALVACFMWLMTTLFSPQYMAHGHKQARYLLFTLLTMGATVGVFLSDDLITAFLFFEILSFTSYCWVIHEQTPAAMRAGQTYLAIAILGGMAMLMGLMMLQQKLGTLAFDSLADAALLVSRQSLYLPGALILAGFGAKAGMFPLHVWLPKAHPVAPAPASALLSGILTKVGIFGILVISSRLFFGDVLWGNLLLVIGLVNMVLGAVLALLSVDLKRTLACSSMSQIGFILFGISMQSLLGEHNALAAQGTVLHMLNHSLIKLVLFMAAGAIYINAHSLNLNDIRGYGRKRPGLMTIFLVGAASLGGIPFFSGYASKTLLHEAVIEYIVHLQHLGESASWYQAAEWLFVITGGITLCYMVKLFVAIFVEKHPTRQAEYDAMGPSMTALSALALGGSALLLLAIGLYPEGVMTRLATLSLPFLGAHEPAHAVHYLAGVNLIGGGKSIAVGILLYFLLARTWLMGKNDLGHKIYLNRWPAWLDLEDGLYRPLLRGAVALGTWVCRPLDIVMDAVVFPTVSVVFNGLARMFGAVERLAPIIGGVLTFLSRLLETLVDGISLYLLRTVLRRVSEGSATVLIGNRFTYALGSAWDRATSFVRKLAGMPGKEPQHYVIRFAAAWTTVSNRLRRVVRTLSFSLVLFGVGLVLLLAYLLIK